MFLSRILAANDSRCWCFVRSRCVAYAPLLVWSIEVTRVSTILLLCANLSLQFLDTYAVFAMTYHLTQKFSVEQVPVAQNTRLETPVHEHTLPPLGHQVLKDFTHRFEVHIYASASSASRWK
jgi:hypothetical protein